MNKPLLSVVIPTHGRAHLLPRAIESALRCSPDDSVEVIVVPNGSDERWKEVAEGYRPNPKITFSRVSKAHANVARNHGMLLARGEFVRFLDDDDYLYPDACRRQCEALCISGSDVSSGNIDVVRDDGKLIRVYAQPQTDDFVASSLMPARMTHPCGHLFRRAAILECRWDEHRAVRQDTAWIIQVASSRELSWDRQNTTMGAWTQHSGPRISRGRDPGPRILQETAQMIMTAYATLESQGRLSSERREAAADGLWSSLQKGLQYDYRYWTSVARTADTFSPGRRPPSLIHRMPIADMIPPLAIELLLVPLRIAYRPLRAALEDLGIGRV